MATIALLQEQLRIQTTNTLPGRTAPPAVGDVPPAITVTLSMTTPVGALHPPVVGDPTMAAAGANAPTPAPPNAPPGVPASTVPQ